MTAVTKQRSRHPKSFRMPGRYRVHITIKGEPYRLGNDYSRDLDDAQFTERYIVRTDPAKALARWPQKVQEAIRTARPCLSGQSPACRVTSTKRLPTG